MRDEPAFSTLSFWERLAFRVMRFLNQGGGSGPAWIWQRGVITPLVGLIDARSRASLRALIGIYSRLLDRIAASDYDVLARRVRVPTWEKLWVLMRSAAV